VSPAGRQGVRASVPDDGYERRVLASGCEVVAGLDEVGRGAWAGPLTVGVVVMPAAGRPPEGVRDSKLLSEQRREALYPAIIAWCGGWAVGHATPAECDRWGMTRALALAARRAIDALDRPPDALLVDGTVDFVTGPAGAGDPDDRPGGAGSARITGAGSARITGAGSARITGAGSARITGAGSAVPAPVVETVVGGDRRCVSIAAASIVAKVTRDRIMRSLAPSFPAFDFASNKGYPAPVHRRALVGYGLTAVHRRSWSYVAELPFR